MSDQEMTNEINEWEQTLYITNQTSEIAEIIIHIIFLIAAIAVLIRVACHYNRKESILIGFPLLLIIDVIMAEAYWYLSQNNSGTKCYVTGGCEPLTRFSATISIFTCELAHLLFSMQYLQTSISLPKLFIEAKIEHVQQDAQPNNSTG